MAGGRPDNSEPYAHRICYRNKLSLGRSLVRTRINYGYVIFSLPLAFSGLMAPENPEFSKVSMFIWTIILGMIYGLLIEVITSLFFKAKIQS